LPRRLSDGSRVEVFSNLPFGPVEHREKHTVPTVEIVGDYRAVLRLKIECRCNRLRWNLDQLLREWHKLLSR
jgi:hypothetical protein